MIERIKVDNHNSFFSFFKSKLYCSLIALLTTMINPMTNGITLAIAFGFVITRIPSMTHTIP